MVWNLSSFQDTGDIDKMRIAESVNYFIVKEKTMIYFPELKNFMTVLVNLQLEIIFINFLTQIILISLDENLKS